MQSHQHHDWSGLYERKKLCVMMQAQVTSSGPRVCVSHTSHKKHSLHEVQKDSVLACQLICGKAINPDSPLITQCYITVEQVHHKDDIPGLCSHHSSMNVPLAIIKASGVQLVCNMNPCCIYEGTFP